MNFKFNAKVWVVALMLVGAQAVYAMEQKSAEDNAEKSLQTDALKDAMPDSNKQPESKAPESNNPIGGEQPAGTPPAQPEPAKEGFFASAITGLKAQCSSFKEGFSKLKEGFSEQCSNVVTFGNDNRMLTALTFGIPAAIALTYKLLPSMFPNIEENSIYKKIKTAPSLAKAALITIPPAAVWAWYYTHQGVVPAVVATPA